MNQVLIADTQIMEIAEENKLPKECNKKSKELGALRLVEEDIDEQIEEIRRRYQFDEAFDINSNERMTCNNESEVNDQS